MRLVAVVCTRNRATWAARAVRSLLAQDLAPEVYEVVAVDNASTDDTGAVLQDVVAGIPNARYVHEPRTGLSRARNRALAETDAEVVAFLDDDAEAVPGWARAHLACFEGDADVVGTGGPIRLGWPGVRPDWLPVAWEGMYAGLDRGNERHVLAEPSIPYGANMAIRRRALVDGPGFALGLGRQGDDLTSGEERELFERIRAAGGVLVYVPEAGVTHHVLPDRLGRRWFLRRAYAQGRSHVLVDEILRPPRSRGYWAGRSTYQALRAVRQAGQGLARRMTNASAADTMAAWAMSMQAAGLSREAARAALVRDQSSKV